jgi:Flp pilus assembly protein TadB
MAGLSRSTCPHGRTPSTCLICQALDAGELSEARRERAKPDRRGAGSLSWTVAKFGIVAVVALVALSWAAALFWTVLRVLELVAVAVVVGWACWRLGVRHGRRNPG